MQQRDLLKEEAERLGKVLGKLMTLLLRHADEAGGGAAVDAADAEVATETNLDIPHLLTLDKPAVQAYLEDRVIPVAAYSPLADYLEAAGVRVPGKSDRYCTAAEWIRQLRDEELGEIPLYRI
ncbi:hypothetical protein [Lewinella sp. IMCC34183]|uniref:hypothetical protein n=1 Tax=Lewinella sp. IMCC34183 TaxID=2248762 RepID=UPI000E26834F|nr:hypothetical protein [Lewinella sp. IMCC34183]